MSKKIFAAALAFPWNEVIVAAWDKAESPGGTGGWCRLDQLNGLG